MAMHMIATVKFFGGFHSAMVGIPINQRHRGGYGGDPFTAHQGPSVHMFAYALHFSEYMEMIMFCALKKAYRSFYDPVFSTNRQS